jgi:hypothetical protein
MTNQLKQYATNGSLMYQKMWKLIHTPERKAFIYKIALSLSIILLLLTTVYAGLHASNMYSTDSNAVILTQQLSKTIHYPIILPGPHATLLIIPLLYIQAHLPYHYTSFTLVNIGLVLITIIAWAFLLIKLFGRAYEIPILILLSSLIFTSVAFSLSIGYTTIRNIEYPIVLWFVMIVSQLLLRRRYSRRQLVLGAIGSVLFSITLAGDSFFNYAILLPLIAVMAWYWIQSREFTFNMGKALGLIAAVFIGSVLLKDILSVTGIIHFDYTFWGHNAIIPASSLAPSLTVALQQLLQLHGAFIFGQIVYYHNLAAFVNFGLLLASIVSLILILTKAGRSFRHKKGFTEDNNFVIVTMAISFFVTFFVYALSGYAITTLNGQIVSDQNARYISFLPLISIIGLIWLLKNYYKDHLAFLVMLFLVLVAGIITGHTGVRTAYATGSQNLELAPTRSSINNIVNILNSNDVKEVQADYWYGPVLSFWTSNSILLAPEIGCSQTLQPSPQTTIQTTSQTSTKSALIIDRGGLNYSFWSCSDAQLTQIYGAPAKDVVIEGAAPGTYVEIWIYNHDIH